MSVWKITWLIALKDLRIERRSRVITDQVLPFAGVTMLIFAFALDADAVLERVAPGLIWLATMFSLLVLVQRAFSIETDDGALDAMRVAGVDARAIYLGKSLSLAVQLLVLEVILLGAAIVLYAQTVPLDGVVLLVTTLLTATCGLASVGTLYGRPCRRDQGPRDVAPATHAPRGGARPDRCNPSGRSGSRHGRRSGVGWLALGGPARRLRRRLRCRRHAGVRTADRRIERIPTDPTPDTRTPRAIHRA